MFAGNGKISAHQISCLLFVNWVGKLLLLLPAFRGTLNGWGYMAAIALGGVWGSLYLALLARLSARVDKSFTVFLRERLGRGFAYFADMVFFFFLLADQVYLAWLAGKICNVFLLPESSETILVLCVLLVGLAAAMGDSQKRGRMAELLFFPVAIALGAMVVASMGTMRVENLSLQRMPALSGVLRCSAFVFLAFSSASLILFETINTNWSKKACRTALQKGLGLTLLFLLTAFLCAIGVLGEASFWRLPWPVPTLMSSASLPGGFLQRWDAVFLAFLLLSLLAASGTTSYYMKRILGEIAPKTGETKRLSIQIFILLAAVLLTGDYGTAEGIYIKWAFSCLLPVIAAMPIFLLLLERKHGRSGS